MAEKVDFGGSREKAIIRTPVLAFKVMTWDWTLGRVLNEYDITPMVVNMTWQKSIKNSASLASLTMIPQKGSVHFLDLLSPMDVLQIEEFGTVKFQGFISRLQTRGEILSDGKPYRSVVLNAQGFGALLTDAGIGVDMFLKAGTYLDLAGKLNTLSATIVDQVKSGGTYPTIIKTIVNSWFDFIASAGGTTFRNYIDYWIDMSAGVQDTVTPGAPKEAYLFNPSDRMTTLWSILQKIAESPFGELWMDNGPRTVWFEAGSFKQMPNGKTFLIMRQTPFDGTVSNGISGSAWSAMSSRRIPINYLTRFDLSKTMEESYSFYMVSPPVYDPGEFAMVAQGRYVFDTAAFNKYLYRPLVHDLYYTRITSQDSADVDPKKTDVFQEALDKSQTLKNWFQNNDKFLSGSFTIMVPSNDNMDPRIGEKVEFDGLDNAAFYVEGIAHKWTYGGTLQADLSVTRGWGIDGNPISMKDKIFKRGRFAMDERFK